MKSYIFVSDFRSMMSVLVAESFPFDQTTQIIEMNNEYLGKERSDLRYLSFLLHALYIPPYKGPHENLHLVLQFQNPIHGMVYLIQGAAFNVTHFKSRVTYLLYTAINTTEHGQISQCLGFTKSLASSIRLGDVLHDN